MLFNHQDKPRAKFSCLHLLGNFTDISGGIGLTYAHRSEFGSRTVFCQANLEGNFRSSFRRIFHRWDCQICYPIASCTVCVYLLRLKDSLGVCKHLPTSYNPYSRE